MPRTILLDGQRLTRRDFYRRGAGESPRGPSPRARAAMQKSRAWVEKIIAEKQVVYGVTTAWGASPPNTLTRPRLANCN